MLPGASQQILKSAAVAKIFNTVNGSGSAEYSVGTRADMTTIHGALNACDTARPPALDVRIGTLLTANWQPA